MSEVAEGYYWARIEQTADVEIVQLIPGGRRSAGATVLRMGSEEVLKVKQVKLLSGPIPIPTEH